MRGIVERRSLAIALTRARGPSCIRKLSGIGRGQGDGREAGIGRRRGNQFSQEDADEPLFPVGGGGYGHGAPLNSNSAAGDRSGVGADLGDEAARRNVALQFGNASAGRGSAGYKPGQLGGAISDSAGPLLPNISLGRGSSLQRPTSEVPLFDDRNPSMPTISLGLGGFGRGKPIQAAVPEIQPEDSFSESHRKVLPKWDETIRKIEEKDNATRAEELKRFEVSRPAVLGYPGPPAAPSVGAAGPRLAQGDNFSSRNTQSPRPTFGFAQQARASDPGRSVLQKEHVKADKGDDLGQAFRSSTLPGWQHKAVSEGVSSGQGWQPSPPQSLHAAVGETPTLTYQQASPPHLLSSEKGELHRVASGQPSRPQFATADDTGRQAPGTFPGLATSMPESHDDTKGESFYRAGRQAAPTFPGLATATSKPYDSTKGESYYNAGRQVPPAFPGLATATGKPYDNSKGAPGTFPGLATSMPKPYDNTQGESYYSAGRQAAPTFPGLATATSKPYDSTKGESFFNAGRQAPPAFPGLATATGKPYDNTKGAPGTFPGLATSMPEPYDNTQGESYYSAGRQAAPTFPGLTTATSKPYDSTKGESYYNAGRQAPPAFPGLATATGKPYDNTKGAPGTFPGLATSMPEPYDNTQGESYYSAGRQAAPTFLGLAAATPKPYDSTKGEPYYKPGSQVPPAFPGLATATVEPFLDTKGESYSSAGRQAPPTFPGLATASSNPYDSTKGESYYSGGRQASPVFSPSGMAESYEDAGRQASPVFSPSGMAESYDDVGRQASPVFSPSGMSETYDAVGWQALPQPSGSSMGESYHGTSRHAAPSAPATSVTSGPLYTASRQAAPSMFSASGSEQFQYDTSGQPIDSAFSAMRLTQDVPTMPYNEESYYQEGWQQAWPTAATPESSQQVPTDFQQTEHWYDDTTSGVPQESFPTSDSTQYFSQHTQGQDGHDSGGWQPSWSASVSPEFSGGNTAPEANAYSYDWIGQSPESTGPHYDSSHLFSTETPLYPEVGSDYDERIEECYTQGRLEVIDGIYDEMKAAQVQASPKTYDTLMQTYMKLGKTEKMSQVYQEMREVIMPSGVKTQKAGVKEETMRIAMKDSIKTQKAGVKEETVRIAMKDKEKSATFAFAEGTGQSGYSASEEMPCSEHEVQTKDNALQQPRQEYDQEVGSGMSTDQSMHPDGSLPGFLPFGMQRPTAGVGAGRGKKVGSFFDFAGSEGLAMGRGQPQPDWETKSEKSDDYSETFRPVIRPELQYAFAPEGLSGIPGAGRGRSLSPQGPDVSVGRGRPLSPQAYDPGVGRGRLSFPRADDSGLRVRIPHPQYMDAAVQPQQPFYTEDMHSEFLLDRSQEQRHPSISREEAGNRAMHILDERLNRKIKRMEEWSRDDDEDTGRRKPVRMAQTRVPKEKRQLIKRPEQEEEVQLTEEQAKDKLESLKAMENNERTEELQHTLSQFMKNYGEMGLELEYLMGDFMTNPDIDEKPLPPLEEYLEKAKPNIMKTGIIRTEGEWQRMVKDVLINASYFEEFVEQYSGPGRYTAKQENEDLEAIAKTLPLDAGPKFQSSIQRSLTTLKSNPGFNLDEKQWMLSNMVDELSELSQYEDYKESSSSLATS